MTTQGSSKTTRQVLGAATLAISVSAMVALTPTTASAFDIGGLIGAAVAAHMGQYHGYSGGHYRSHTASRRDRDSDDHDTPKVERDARDPVPATPASSGKSDNHVAAHQQKIQGPSSSSGGAAQASEHDAATAQIASAGKSFDDAPAFNPSR